MLKKFLSFFDDTDDISEYKKTDGDPSNYITIDIKEEEKPHIKKDNNYSTSSSYSSDSETDSEDYFYYYKYRKIQKKCLHIANLIKINHFFEKNEEKIIENYLKLINDPNWIRSFLKLKIDIQQQQLNNVVCSYYIPKTEFEMKDDIRIIDGNTFLIKESLYSIIKFNFCILAVNNLKKKILCEIEKKNITKKLNLEKVDCSCKKIDNLFSYEKINEQIEFILIISRQSEYYASYKQSSSFIPNEFLYLLCGGFMDDDMKKINTWYLSKLSYNETLNFEEILINKLK